MITRPVSNRSAREASGTTQVLVVGIAVFALALAGALFAVGPQPAAAAASPRISVSPSSGLNPEGDYVMVSGSGFKPNIQLFVMQCRNNSGEDHTCNSVGLQKVSTDAGGSFSTRRPVQVSGNMGATDCRVTPCAIKTSAVSGHSGDRSQDVQAAISFAAPTAPPATQPPATQPPATQPPATQPPATQPSATQPSDTTEAPSATTTTEAGAATTTTTEVADTTTTTEVSGTTTTAATDAEVTEVAGGTEMTAGSDDDDGSSPLPWIVGGIVLLGAAGGGIYVARSRTAG